MTATELISELRRHGARVATAESCTGGLVANLLTDVPGASDVVWGGFVTYQTAAKRALGVPAATLRGGEVTRVVAIAMARAALCRMPPGQAYAVATTGNAGPTGQPVGRCWIAVATRGAPARATKIELGKRERRALKRAFARAALRELGIAINGKGAGSLS